MINLSALLARLHTGFPPKLWITPSRNGRLRDLIAGTQSVLMHPATPRVLMVLALVPIVSFKLGLVELTPIRLFTSFVVSLSLYPAACLLIFLQSRKRRRIAARAES